MMPNAIPLDKIKEQTPLEFNVQEVISNSNYKYVVCVSRPENTPYEIYVELLQRLKSSFDNIDIDVCIIDKGAFESLEIYEVKRGEYVNT